MENIVRDKYEQGLREGEARGYAKGRAEEMTVSTEIAIAGVVSLMYLNNMSFDEAATRLAIPKDRLKDIEAKVRKRIATSS